MNTTTLEYFGLTKPQARAYVSLVKNGHMTAKQISEKIGESRTNTYMILEKLSQLGLIHKNTDKKILRYFPSSPLQLQNIVETKRQDILVQERTVKEAMPALLSYFYTYQEQPGVRFFQGIEGITKMYEDQRITNKDIHFLRTDADFTFLGNVLSDHIEKRTKLGIKSYGIQPDSPRGRQYAENDQKLHREITWMPPGVFTAPVNVYVYGSKVGLISYGEEAIGTIIESPQLAQAFKQILNVVRVASPILMKEQKKTGNVKAIMKNLPSVKPV